VLREWLRGKENKGEKEFACVKSKRKKDFAMDISRYLLNYLYVLGEKG
jgi:hypothetical protein